MRNFKSFIKIIIFLVIILALSLVFGGIFKRYTPLTESQATEVIINEEITGEQVWQAYQEEVEIKKTSPQKQEIMKPYIVAIPNILKDYLDKQVTAKNLLNAQVKVIEYMVNNGFSAVFVERIPPEKISEIGGKEKAIAQIDESLSQLVLMVKMLSSNIDDIIKPGSEDERELITKGLNKENIEKYDNGTLTIYDIVVSQPSILML